MKTARNRFCRLAAAVSLVLLVGASATHSVVARAADGPMPCSAFERNSGGSWRVLAPVTLAVNNHLYSPMVGTVLPAGASENGIEMSDVLDRQCGNR